MSELETAQEGEAAGLPAMDRAGDPTPGASAHDVGVQATPRPANWRSLRNRGRIKTRAEVIAARRRMDAYAPTRTEERQRLDKSVRRGQRVASDGSVVCPICAVRTKDKVADHCHETGATRDWLCRKCNGGLGFFDDDPERMRAAAAYIERHRAFPQTNVGYALETMRRLSKRQVERMVAEILKSETA